MDSDVGIEQAIQEDRTKWFLTAGKIGSALFFAANYVMLRKELNLAGCRYALGLLTGGQVQ